MELARRTAESFGLLPFLPLSLQGRTLRQTTTYRAVFLDRISQPLFDELEQVQRDGGPLIAQEGLSEQDRYLIPRIRLLARRIPNHPVLAELTRHLIPDVPDLMARLNITMRMWAGYMDTAKAIDEKTMDGPITPEQRGRWMLQIDHIAATDPIYAAGVVATPTYKRRMLREPIFREGIPQDSIVLMDWDD